MVHALEECWRVLRSKGMLIDLRPIRTAPQFEILTDAGPESAGAIDDYGHIIEDRAGDAAVQSMVDRGLFNLERVTRFRFAFYWDSVGAMQDYSDEKWTTTKIPKQVMTNAKRLEGEAYGPVKIRVRRKLHLAIYSKK